MISAPSRNLAPRTILGKRFSPFNFRHALTAATTRLNTISPAHPRRRQAANGRARSPSCSRTTCEDRFGRPGKGNDKGKVEGLVGYARRNFLVPIPVFESFEALNAYLLECCRQRLMEVFSADEVATAVRNAIARGAIGFDAHRSRCRPRQQTHVRLGRRHRHMGPRQIRIDRHVEARRSTFDVAQHQVLYCLTTPARRSRRVSRRYHWCATGSTTTRRRRLTVTATCLCAIASMTW